MSVFRQIPLSWPIVAGWLTAINGIAGICYIVVWPEITIEGPQTECKGVARFHISSPSPLAREVKVWVSTRDGLARQDDDYEGIEKEITLGSDPKTEVVEVELLAKPAPSPAKCFSLVLMRTEGARTRGRVASAIIAATEPPPPPPKPTVFIGDTEAKVSDGITSAIRLLAQLERPSADNSRVGVKYTTEDGSARAGIDYRRSEGTLVFESGESAVPIVVPLTGDCTDDSPKSFWVCLAPTRDVNIDPQRSRAEVRLKYEPPLLTGRVLSASEADQPGTIQFELRLSRPTRMAAMVECDTRPGTAKPDVDYLPPAPHFVVWKPGETIQFVQVKTVENSDADEFRTFEMLLRKPEGLRLTTPRVQARIGPALRFLGQALVLVIPTRDYENDSALLSQLNQVAEERPKDVWCLGHDGHLIPWGRKTEHASIGQPFGTDHADEFLAAFQSASEAISRLRDRAENPDFVTFLVWCTKGHPDDLESEIGSRLNELISKASDRPVYLVCAAETNSEDSKVLREAFRQRRRRHDFLTNDRPKDWNAGWLANLITQELQRLKQ